MKGGIKEFSFSGAWAYGIAVLVVTLVSAGVPGPKILGLWESYYYFVNFGSLDCPLGFQISPRANIGDPGHGFLEISRLVLQWLQIPLCLESYRFPAVIFGILSLFFFFQLARRYFGPPAALASTSLLAVNPMFHQQMHTMTVLIVSGMGFLFFLERLQKIEFGCDSPVTWGGLVLAAMLVALHYGVGRIYAGILLVAWLIKAWWILRRDHISRLRLLELMKKMSFSFLAFLALLFLLHPSNLRALLKIGSFFFPVVSEIALVSNLYKNDFADLWTAIFLNGRILLEATLLNGGNFHAAFPTYRIADYRYPLLVTPLVPAVLAGFYICIRKISERKQLLATPWLSTLFLAMVCVLPQLFSAVFLGHPTIPDSPLATLSNHRMYFILFPLYLLVAAAVSSFLSWAGQRGAWKFAASLFIFGVVAFCGAGLFTEKLRFFRQLNSINPSLYGISGTAQWADGTANLDRPYRVMASHLQQHAQYFRAAHNVLKAVKPEIQKGSTILVEVDANLFTESPLCPSSLPYLRGFNFHAPFLSLYLYDAGIDHAWILMTDSHGEKKSFGFAPPRLYSAPMELDRNGKLRYSRPADLNGNIRYDGVLREPKVILATTPEESAFGRRWLEGMKRPFQVIKFSSL